MKILFDENLSSRLATLLSDIYAGSLSVISLGLGGVPDEAILQKASEGSFLLASKDSDFVDRLIYNGTQVKVIWIRLGNCTTEAVHLVLRNSADRILEFSNSADRVLELP